MCGGGTPPGMHPSAAGNVHKQYVTWQGKGRMLSLHGSKIACAMFHSIV